MDLQFHSNGRFGAPSIFIESAIRSLPVGLQFLSAAPGDSVRIARELQELTQSELAAACEMPQATISSIERGRVVLGAARA